MLRASQVFKANRAFKAMTARAVNRGQEVSTELLVSRDLRVNAVPKVQWALLDRKGVRDRRVHKVRWDRREWPESPEQQVHKGLLVLPGREEMTASPVQPVSNHASVLRT